MDDGRQAAPRPRAPMPPRSRRRWVVPTVSREHARFTFADGQWWVANLGRNGLTLNGVPVQAGRVVRDGDVIRWGQAPDAPASRVGIG